MTGPWDVIVIGTGIGGGTVGRQLAEAGLRVLFVEKGHDDARSARNGLSDSFVPEARATRGLWPEPLEVTVDGAEQRFYAPRGAGVGGSSVFYAATLERPERHDLEEVPDRAHPTGGWPVGFDEFAPYFARAAQVYRVYGTPDPLSPEVPLPLRDPPAPSAVETALMDGLRARGLHPYHAHTAVERLDGCAMCLGHKCPRACKMDGRSAGVEPALATGRAALITGAEVTRILSDGPKVTGVELRHRGAVHQLQAKHYVLAAGALASPVVLLQSACGAWPKGLANGSGLVGRNLMFHLNEMFALWPGVDGPATKAVSLRDLYHRDGQRLGTVQAMGIRASYGEIVFYLNRMLSARGLDRLHPFSRLPAAIAARMLGSAQLFVGLMEDLPYADNRVLEDGSVVYHISDELRQRRRAFRRAIRRSFPRKRMMLGVQPELNWGHPCGTLRFGTDPAQSVLNPQGRAHGLRNLWVSDASFMPTSMGVNPSLTIAAQALRVADAMEQDLCG